MPITQTKQNRKSTKQPDGEHFNTGVVVIDHKPGRTKDLKYL